MRILVGGASGLVGGALLPRLKAASHDIVRLTRGGRSGGDAVLWDPDRGILEPSMLRGFDAVVHLGGASIASGRWTVKRKQLILESRTRSTLLLAERIAALPSDSRPRAFVVASATGYYGNRGDTPLDESSGPGDGFLADVCRAWEEASEPVARAGVRVVRPRIGVVLARDGGALAAMLP
ncbi:MAG TPA: NAD-dependent epimerase/dehydratase family protein, partial [Acidobacteriota bacterium]|nr:NAD-dependent epimerase/dehydratase family protein [Acidobacteriota bacterium]